MNHAAKQKITSIGCALAGTLAVFCIGRMIPYGLSGDTAKVKEYFILAIIAVIVGLLCGMASLYYRSDADNTHEIDLVKVQLDILAQTKQKPPLPRPSTNNGSGHTRKS